VVARQRKDANDMNHRHRRTQFGSTAALVSLALTACGGPGGSGGGGTVTTPPPDMPPSTPTLAVQRVFPALSFSSPLGLLQSPNDSTRWYVVQQGGLVRRFDNVAGASTATTYLDLSGVVTCCGETGLLGMAFHPNFPADPRVFVYYTLTIGTQLVSRLSSFQATNGGLNVVAGSETVLLQVNQPESNHNGGQLAFGADGLLYLGLGDGGGGGDQHGTIGNGQNTQTLLGKIIRIDVNATQAPYGIPTGNPFAGNTTKCNATGIGVAPCPEIYAYGLRNPWRFSFDRDTGSLWIGDVGQDLWEEVDRINAPGVNLGWRCREGAHDYNTACGGATNLTEPVAEYGHGTGVAVIGGFVYRGTAYANLRGWYVCGDLNGSLFLLSGTTPTGSVQTLTRALSTGYSITSFGEGNDRELYVIDAASGGIFRVTAS
jgi:glucose/arabinose dehydrogenase